MAVYVDDMKAPFGNMIMCHMLADTDEELHRMAEAIGVSRRHWQSPEKTSGSHYDICLAKKALALRLGAIPITLRQAAAMNAHRRVHGNLGDPDGAVLWLKARARIRQDLDFQVTVPITTAADLARAPAVRPRLVQQGLF